MTLKFYDRVGKFSDYNTKKAFAIPENLDYEIDGIIEINFGVNIDCYSNGIEAIDVSISKIIPDLELIFNADGELGYADLINENGNVKMLFKGELDPSEWAISTEKTEKPGFTISDVEIDFLRKKVIVIF